MRLKALKYDGWMAPDEMQWLYEVGKSLDGIIVEIGSYKGRSSGAILQGIKDGGKRSRLICVDSFDKNPEFIKLGGRHKPQLLKHNLREISAIKWDLWEMDSLAAAAKTPDASLSAIFIDGSHDYESVKADLVAWMPKLKPGALLSGHDYHTDFQGVIDAVRDHVGPVKVLNTIWYTGVT